MIWFWFSSSVLAMWAGVTIIGLFSRHMSPEMLYPSLAVAFTLTGVEIICSCFFKKKKS